MHAVDEAAKGLVDFVESAVVVEVIGLDVGHDGALGMELQKTAVVLTSLDGEPTTGLFAAGVGLEFAVEAPHEKT